MTVTATDLLERDPRITREEREMLGGHKGCTIWLTGLSAAGKSTLAKVMETALCRRGVPAYVLDGDTIRGGLNNDLGFSPDARAENIRRLGEVARLFTEAGAMVIVACISPSRADRGRVRASMRSGDFIEVFVDAPLEVCEERDPKGLYVRARAGGIAEFTGVSAPYEVPVRPELRLRTDQGSPADGVERMLAYLEEHGYLPLRSAPVSRPIGVSGSSHAVAMSPKVGSGPEASVDKLLAPSGALLSMPLCQIALSATDLSRTHYWYRRALGLVAAGQRRRRELPGRSPITDLPELALDVWCLTDQREWFQFEMFEFQKPRMRRQPEDARLSDIGYSMIGFHVDDFDEALDRLRRTSGRPLGSAIGPRGRRRICLRDPEGILVELMEDDVRQPGTTRRTRVGGGPTTRFITLSVPDLDRARRFWVDALGLVDADDTTLHTSEHEVLWGTPGAARQTMLLWASDFLVELVQHDCARSRPAGYLMSDQGIFNVALGSMERTHFDEVYHRVLQAGYVAHSEPWTLSDIATVVYLQDDQGFSVELLHVEPSGLEHMGFVPTPE